MNRFALYLLLIVIGLAIITGCGTVSREGEAFYTSQKFVEGKLKCPSTAKFPGYPKKLDVDSVVIEQGEGSYLVRSYVDSENGFGAMVRIKYVCTLHPIDGGKWELDSLELTEQ